FGPGIVAPAETATCTDPGNGTGAFVHGRSVRPAEFLDGLSNTAMFSERVMGGRGAYRPYSDYLVSLPDICTTSDAIGTCSSLATGGLYDAYAGATWLFGGWRQTWYNHLFTPNSPVPDCNANPIASGGGRGAYTARSYHPGGVNSAMADGSARFVSQDIDLSVWRALATRGGGATGPRNEHKRRSSSRPPKANSQRSRPFLPTRRSHGRAVARRAGKPQNAGDLSSWLWRPSHG
ncbi:MAG: hypothetical protein B7Z73_19840, partial [Planctomycetia bacterium 21-64-5]